MESSTESLDSIPAALDQALTYIGLHDLITDRHTLLCLRLVCRAFRRNDGLSSRITTIQLRTPEDLTSSLRFLELRFGVGPWRDPSDAGPFRSVRKLLVHRLLGLRGDTPHNNGRWASIFNTVRVGVAFRHLQDPRWESVLHIREIGLEYKNLLEFTFRRPSLSSRLWEDGPVWVKNESVSSLSIGTIGREGILQKFGFAGFDGILQYEHLTYLAILGLRVYQEELPGQHLMQLTALQSLQHLELRLYFSSLYQLELSLAACGTLTQLRRLELELEFSPFEGLTFTVRGLEGLLYELAPPHLKKCKIYNHSSTACILTEAEFKNNELQNCEFYLTVAVDELDRCAESVAIEVRRLVQEFEASGHFQRAEQLYLILKLPGTCFLTQVEIDVSIFKGANTVMIVLDRAATDEEYNHAWGVFGQTLINPSGVTLSVNQFSLYHDVRERSMSFEEGDFTPGTDASAVLATLPALMPNLDDFRTDTIRASPECISELRCLTKLTFLSILSNQATPDSEGPVLDLSLLPSSLQSLNMWGRSFEPTPTPSLPHLTSIYVSGLHDGEPGLGPFRHCGAPLRELIYWGHERAEVVLATFPRLEKLTFVMVEADVAPLGSLPVLRELLLVKRAEVHEFVGLPSLTQITKLKIRMQREASNWLEVSQLTQLRKLSISMEQRMLLENLDPDGPEHTQIYQSLEQVNKTYQEYLSKLMPRTTVKIQ